MVAFIDLSGRFNDHFRLGLNAHAFNLPTNPYPLMAMKSRRRRARVTAQPTGRVSSHFTREGTPKNSYRTEQEAKGAAQLAWTLNGAELNAYRCDFCHQWHIGKPFRED